LSVPVRPPATAPLKRSGLGARRKRIFSFITISAAFRRAPSILTKSAGPSPFFQPGAIVRDSEIAY
jgi:hypothetical protein